MPTGRIVSTINVGGISMSSEVTRTVEGQIGHSVALPAGSDGDMASYTGIANITVDMADGYVIGDGETADVYWYESGVLKVKYGATTALAASTITLTVGEGDGYPDNVGLGMVITEQVSINTDFVGNEVEMLALSSDKLTHAEFRGAAATIDGVKIPAGESWSYLKNGKAVNILAGDTVATIEASCGNADDIAMLKIGVLYDSA